ncbi:ArnT family glycosyltransferase [Frigidibacter sp. MR17.24]|uniref:ArnT family glycosyltransferase n=1 Tax=Frigidibacter sp. MR17.24 TaxID=3127345 RepID=UPI003012DB41
MRADRSLWIAPALVFLAALTALRLVTLALTPIDLFVDEAQYWLWGQNLAFGYYSKPPLVGWVIRATTALGGDGTFWVRLAAPLLHAATALILGGLTARLAGPRAALFVAISYATLPMVALSSILISTDTVMFPFLGLALWAWVIAAGRGGVGPAVCAGLALGLGLMAKYAAIYVLGGFVLLQALVPALRLGARQWLGFGLALLATVAPNLLWNAAHGFSTFEHTLDNADWVRDPEDRIALSPARAAGFLLAQFGVFGPVLFGALIALVVSVARGATGAPQRWLLAFVLPAIAVVTAQAFLSGAYANWAASAYLAATVALVPWLMGRARVWLVVSLALNTALAVALAVGTIFADRMPGLYARYLGRAEVSHRILETARQQQLQTVVAADRGLLADLFYTGRDSGLLLRARPEAGRPSSHYALSYPLEPGIAGDVLYADRSDDPPACPDRAVEVGVFTPSAGAWAGDDIHMYRVPADCLAVVAQAGGLSGSSTGTPAPRSNP